MGLLKLRAFPAPAGTRLTVLLLLCALLSGTGLYAAKTAFQQTPAARTVTGVIKDGTGMPLIGATVLANKSQEGTITNVDGEFTLPVTPADDSLYVTYIGYEPTRLALSNKSVFTVIMNESANALEEVVVVGFGTQKKESLVSSITSIAPDEIKGPTGNLTNMMAGRVSGMIAFQRSGEPGANNSDFFIRGLSSFGSGKVNPLILIDGVESTTTDMARLQPDDIASFSVLKDAAASAVYGARGANGVVLIKTKMGRAGETKFHYRLETNLSANTQNFALADNITYMQLANEAALTRNPNAVLPYSQNKIDRTAAGGDPLLYPSNNWIDDLVKDYAVNFRNNLAASGGGEKVTYHLSGTYNVDNGVLDVDGINNFNNNIKLRNYSLRSNVELNLTPSTEAIVRVYGQFDDYNGPVGGGGRIFNYALWSNPVQFPAVYPTESLPFIEHPLFGGAPAAGGRTLLVNPYAQMVRGYQDNKASTVQAQVQLTQDLSSITEGLSLRSMGYVRRYSYYEVSRRYNPFYYQGALSPIDNSLGLNVLNGGFEGSIGLPGQEFLNYNEGQKNLDSRIYNETALNYNRTFGRHAVSGMLLNLISSFETGNSGTVQSSLPTRNHGISGRFTYGFDNRYLLELNFGYNGSERFALGNRYGFFPSFGLGYRISNERFWEPLAQVVSNLKLRLTYGLVGNDQIGDVDDRFFYLSNVNLNDLGYGANFGLDFGYGRPGIFNARYANYNIGWETSEQINVGFDLELFNSLGIIVDVFRQRRENILQERTNIGSTVGLTAIPSTNFGKVESSGFDGSATYNKQLGRNWYTQLRGNFTYATNKILEYDEVSYPSELSYRSVIGQNVSQQYGYIAERLFVDHEETLNSPQQIGEYTGGDIKYRDVNGDGRINQNDMVPIGHPTVPEIVYGFGGTVGFKNFDFSLFFQGVARTSIFISPWNIAPFVTNVIDQLDNNTLSAQNGLLQIVADDYWSEADRDSYAFWPRLSDQFVENNNQNSTWWMRDGAFLRLKSIEAGYNLPDGLLSRIGIESMRVYGSAFNLGVWSRFKLWDPEMGGNGLGYPIQVAYNLGISTNF